jgi:UDP-N-acetylmuramoyl-tripeptide--D-alanyl-D-alanine ligase
MKTIDELYHKYKLSSGVCIDSRKLENQNIFFCIKGDSFDGHEFAEESLNKGANFVVVDNKQYFREDDPRYLLVANTLVALQMIANYHRETLNIPLIAITGTNGKTTSKELINTVLSTRFKTHATKGNFNNHIGLPLTILDMEEDTDIAIIEMGASGEHEISFLCDIAQPNYGIITNIGKAHLEGFGSLEGVKRAKGELYSYIRNHKGKLFINDDLDYLKEMSKGVNSVFYGTDHHIKTYGKITKTHPHISVLYNNTNIINTQLAGTYNFPNVMLAVSIGLYFNVEADAIRRAIENYKPEINRSQSIKYKNADVILDAYNANPSSMLAAISSFNEKPKHKGLVILGDMMELGADSHQEHKSLIEYVLNTNIDCIAVVGPLFCKAGEEISSDMIRTFLTFDDVYKWFQKESWNKWDILIKGSRALNMEKLLA